MFQLKFFVEDKLLGEALKRLAGIARNVEHAYVPNVEPAKGPQNVNGHGVRMSAADAQDLIMKHLHDHKVPSFQGPQMKNVLSELGMPTSSYSHYLQRLCDAGRLKKGKLTGNTMTYTVVK